MAAVVMQPQAPHSLSAILNYHLEVHRGGEEIWGPGTVRDKRRPYDQQRVEITNIRGQEANFTLDKQGFRLDPFATSITDLAKDSEFEGQYYQEVSAHMKKITGASTVLPVSHICRRQRWEEVVEAEKDMPDDSPVLAPTSSRAVHIDQSNTGAETVRDEKLSTLPASEAERLRRQRWAIINLWRPLTTAVTRDNLALCDARTVDEKDLVAVTATISDAARNAGKGYKFSSKSRTCAWMVKANPDLHKWYYYANVEPTEALLIKQFDSRTDPNVARRTPHTAFAAKEDYGPTRQSIEVRCLLFWEDSQA